MATEDLYPYPLIVEGEWDQNNAKLLKNKLQIYFQSKKKSNGGDCIVDYDDPASNQAVVRFASDLVRCLVLEKETHQIDLQKRGIICFTVRLPSQAATERDVAAEHQLTPGQDHMLFVENQPTSGKEKQDEQFLEEQKTLLAILSNTNISDEHLRKYFKNFSSGVGPLPYFNREGRKLTLTYANVEDARAVLRQRVHSIENIQLTVERYCDKRGNTFRKSSSVVLQNLPEDITYEILGLLVESVSRLVAVDDQYSMEILSEINAAVVTFKIDIDLHKFVQKCSKKVLNHKTIEAKVLETTASLRVENLPSNITEDYLKLYFEAGKNGCGNVSSVEISPEDRAAVISFENSEVLDIILSQGHMIDKTPVSVYLYYNSLGSALYGNKRPVVKMPDPFMVDVDCYVLQFLKGDKRRIAEINDKMSACYCDIAFPESEQANSIKISPTFSRHKSSFEKLAKNWKNEASCTLTHVLSKYKTTENEVNESVWEIIKNDLVHYLNQNVTVIPNIANGKVIVTGTCESVNSIQQTYSLLVNDAVEKLERETQSVIETVSINPANYLLLRDYLESSVSKQFPNLSMKYISDANDLTLYGLSSEVYVVKSNILEKIVQMKEKPANLDPCLINFLQKVSCEKVSFFLFTSNGINAVCDIQGNSAVVRGSTDASLNAAEKQISRHLTFKCIEVQDPRVIRKNEWTHLKDKLDERLNSGHKQVEIEEKTSDGHVQIIISGYSDAVKEMSEKLGDFIKKNTVIHRNIPFKFRGVLCFLMDFEKIKTLQLTTPGVQIEVNDRRNDASVSVIGPEENVCQAEKSLLDAASKVTRRVLKITTPGAKKFYKEEEDSYVHLTKSKFNCIVRLIEHNDMEGNDVFSQVSCKVQLPNGPAVGVYKGDLTKSRVDVVVNAANENLKHIGGLAKALLDAAGAVLQNDCDWIVNQRGSLKPGDVVITDAGKLPCSSVIHAVGPRWMDTDPNTAKMRLTNAIIESLHLAEANNFNSIAIPALSSGIFGFPLNLCAEIIVTSIRDYFMTSRTRSTLKEIHLVNNDDKTVSAVLDATQKIFGDLINSSPVQPTRFASNNTRGRRSLNYLHQAQTKEGLNILVVKGNIEDITAAVIVNVIGMDLKLSSGAVSKAISAKAGPELGILLQKEGHKNRPFIGKIYETKGCNLDCNEVYHAIVPRWDRGTGSSEKVLKNLIKDCLKSTEGSQLGSIAFPAIGTGNLSFPKDVVARIMFKVVLKHSIERKSAHLQTVYLVVHPDDHLSTQAISCEFQNVFAQQPKSVVPIEQQKATGLFGKMSFSSFDQAEIQIGPTLLQVVSGDITKEKTDVIVNSSNQKFTLKSGVSKAILDAAGPAVEIECCQKGLAANNGIIITNPGNLQGCKGIIHMVGQTAPNQIKAVVGTILKICEQRNFSSVSFPALGTGQGQANPSQVADAMIDSVAEFVQKKPLPCLKKIRIVIFQSQMLSEFHSSMKKREGSDFPENQSFLKKITNAFTSVFWEGRKRNEVFFTETNIEFKDDIEPAHFEICGIEKDAVDDSVCWIKNLVSKEQAEKIIVSRYLYEFSEKEFEELNNLQRSLQIILVLQCMQPQAQIKICGLVKDVLTAFTKIQEMIDCFRGNEFERRNEELIKNLVQWQFQDGAHYVPFDSATNLKLEKEFNNSTILMTVEIHNKHYTVDFNNCTANMNGETAIHLKRILKTEGMPNVSLPNHWDDMQTLLCRSVQLQQQSKEYQEVEQSFRATVIQFVIIKIERIQNPYLWKNYMIKKQLFDEKNPAKTKNERNLFHGTAPDTLESISHFGFNRSFAGRNATMYGNGTYFARDAQYSSSYSKCDTNGMRYMYLARVLTGMYCQGNQGMITPLSKNPSNPTDLFDSAVDNISNPSMFLIFNDIQAYPEYLITFK